MKKLIKIHYSLFLALIILGLSACHNPEEDVISQEVSAKIEGAPVGEIVKVMYNGVEVEAEKIGDDLILDGDIVITPDNESNTSSSARTAGAGRSAISKRWPNGAVFYTIDPKLPSKWRVSSAIAHWERNTNIRFYKRSNQKDYVHFQPAGDFICNSRIGKMGGRQLINLGKKCTLGSAIHEIGHAVGLYHEMSRSDRDKHVTIHWANIKNPNKHNFNKYPGNEGFLATTTFDFGSIMMYGHRLFSKNGKSTITKKNGSTYAWNTTKLSNLDRASVLTMYERGNRKYGPFRYDLGPEWSTVLEDHVPMFPGIRGNIGWFNHGNLRSAARSHFHPVNKDFIFSSQPAEFRHPLSPGNYKVEITFGDQSHMHDKMVVLAEGKFKLWQEKTNPGQFVFRSFTTWVGDGVLNLRFQDNGGADPNRVVTRIAITKV